MKKIKCIYEIQNKINGKRYIGSTVNLKRRIREHLYDLEKGNHHSPYLQRAFNKYGISAFIFNVLELITDEYFLIENEQKWIDFLNPEYNILKIAGSPLGYKHSDEAKEKIRKAITGIKRSDETNKKNSESNMGRKRTKESIEKQKKTCKTSKVFLDSRRNKETFEKRKKTREKNGTNKVSEETKEKISKTLKNKKLKSHNSIKLEQYDMNGFLIQSHDNMIQAENFNNFGRGTLHYNLVKMKKTEYKGFIWKVDWKLEICGSNECGSKC